MKQKTKLTKQEFGMLTIGMSIAIDEKFTNDEKFNVYMTSSEVHYDPATSFEVFTLRVIVTKK